MWHKHFPDCLLASANQINEKITFCYLVTVAHNPLRKVEFRYKISNKMLSEKVKKAILVTLNVC